MKLFSHHLPIAWEYHVRTVLWRVHHGVAGRIVGEERVPDKKETYFFCLDQHSGRVLWERVAVEEPWWIGISFVEEETLFLHGYASPDLPVERGVTALDVATGRILWAQPEWRVEARSPGGLIVSSADRAFVRYYEINSRTGEVQREVDGDEEDLVSRSGQSEDDNVTMPVAPPEASLDVESLRVLHDHLAADESRTRMECVNLPACLVVGRQEVIENDPMGTSHVRVTLHVLKKPSGEELFRDTIAKRASGFVPGAYFVQGNILHYVREQSPLCAVLLPEQ